MTKRFLLDTNVLLHDPKSIEVFADNEVIIPIPVLDELDHAKTRPDEVGRNARSVIRRLDELRALGSLNTGVRLPSGSVIRVELNHRAVLPPTLSDSVDNRLIRTAMGLQQESPDVPVIVVTKDINMRVKCDALGIMAQDYEKDKLAKTPDALYAGFETLNVLSSVIDELYSHKIIDIDLPEKYPNKFILLQSLDRPGHSGLGRLTKEGRLKVVNPPNGAWGIAPRNLEQKMALNLLMDPSVKLVTLVGRAGSGKTLLAAATALQQTVETKTFQRALLSRPVQPMGRDIGFLPGTITEKLAPWMAALNDSLELLFAKDIEMLETYKHQGIIQVEPLTYIRGRSIPNSFMIVDECLPYDQHVVTEEGKRQIGALYHRWLAGQNLPKVLAFNENSRNFEWQEISHAWCRGTRELVGFRCANRQIKCTSEHKFLTLQGWQTASSLKIGDILLTSIDENHPHQMLRLLNSDQEQVVLGSFLGDGNIANHGRKRFRLRVTHGLDQKDYCAWKADLFGAKLSPIAKNGFAQKPACRFWTHMFAWEGEQFPLGKKHHCPKWVLDKLDARGLAIWFMDDGTGYKNGGLLHTCDFDQVSQQRFVEKLASMGIESKVVRRGSYPSIYINSAGAKKLYEIIAPFCHDTMRRKLSGFDSEIGSYRWDGCFQNVGATVVDSLIQNVGVAEVYDLEVADVHTFVLCSSSKGKSKSYSGVITHNCQNLTTHEIKTIVTRIGEGSKIVLCGDVEQIDNPFVDFASNGLTNAIERLKDYGITGHVTLNKCERSELAELAAEAL